MEHRPQKRKAAAVAWLCHSSKRNQVHAVTQPDNHHTTPFKTWPLSLSPPSLTFSIWACGDILDSASAATRNTSSVMPLALVRMAAWPTAGKMYALLACQWAVTETVFDY